MTNMGLRRNYEFWDFLGSTVTRTSLTYFADSLASWDSRFSGIRIMTMSLVILHKIKSISLLERTSFKNIRLDKFAGLLQGEGPCKGRDRGARPSSPVLADQSALVQPGGTHYAHHITKCTPDFQTLRRP